MSAWKGDVAYNVGEKLPQLGACPLLYWLPLPLTPHRQLAYGVETRNPYRCQIHKQHLASSSLVASNRHPSIVRLSHLRMPFYALLLTFVKIRQSEITPSPHSHPQSRKKNKKYKTSLATFDFCHGPWVLAELQYRSISCVTLVHTNYNRK